MFTVPRNSEITPGHGEGWVKKQVFVLQLNVNRWKQPEVGEEGCSVGRRQGSSWGEEKAGWKGGPIWGNHRDKQPVPGISSPNSGQPRQTGAPWALHPISAPQSSPQETKYGESCTLRPFG